MLYRAGNRWELCPYKVNYVQHGQEIEQYTHDPQFWEDFADRWDHTEIQSVEEVTYTDAEKERAEEVRRVPNGFHSAVVNYVKDGTFPEGNNHPLRQLQNVKENESQGEDINSTANFASIVAMDKDELAEMLTIAFQRIDKLEVKVNG